MLKSDIEYTKVILFSIFAGFLLWVNPYIWGHYVDISFPYISHDQIPYELIRLQGQFNQSKEYCPAFSPLIIGIDARVYELLEETNLTAEEFVQSSNFESGGIWQPFNCQARFESVIIVPYRNRPKQLRIFLNYLHPFLQRQQLHYRILVVEQTDDLPFNRARLLNIGFVEARKFGHPAYCFIFHDVDLLPLDDRNIYGCTHHPRHMYSAVDVFRFHLPYRSLAGGAFAILGRHFEAVNGYSNSFEGWGGEDDDFSRRLHQKGLDFQRFDPRIARYVMIPHKREKPSEDRWKVLSKSERNLIEDGLTTLTYEVLQTQNLPLYTHIYVKW